MPQTCSKWSILPTSCNLSTSCNKIKLVATCHLQTCYNFLKQLATSLSMESYNNQLATTLLTTCNKSLDDLQQTCCHKLLQDINRLVTTCAILAVYGVGEMKEDATKDHNAKLKTDQSVE